MPFLIFLFWFASLFDAKPEKKQDSVNDFFKNFWGS